MRRSEPTGPREEGRAVATGPRAPYKVGELQTMSPTSRTPGRHLGDSSEICPLLSARSGETIVLWVLFCDLPKMFAFATLHLLFSVAH